MARQSATQHLGILEAAGLVTSVRDGRRKLLYLNPVPLNDIQERWIQRFEVPRLRALSAVRRRAEDQMGDKPQFVYVTYIESTPARVWEALTDAELSGRYWGHANVSDWEAGSRWEHVRTDGSRVADVVGVVEVSDPPRRPGTTGSAPHAPPGRPPARGTVDPQPHRDILRPTRPHEGPAEEAEREAAAGGWAAVLSTLKSFIETGHPLPQAPWEMAAGR